MGKTVLFTDKKDCCGCAACLNICPGGAIAMKPDEYGFMYPAVDDDKCIGCGLCDKACNYKNRKEPLTLGETYAAMAVDKKLLKKSASGGIFAAVAENILKDGGIVYGCEMSYDNGKLSTRHTKVESVKELYKLQGSKYLQSNIGKTFRDVKESVKTGKKVLFSGTPCQVAGLNGFFKNNLPENLFTIDIICHGVGSEELFLSYIEDLEKKKSGKVKEFFFRDKTLGYGLVSRISLEKNSGEKKDIIIPYQFNSFYWLFLKSEIYRENCYSCPYAGKNRPADITIGDYWGIGKEHPELFKSDGGSWDETEGISCIIINNDKGKEFFETAFGNIDTHKSEFEKAAKWNRQLNAPSKCTELRGRVLKSYARSGYKGVKKVYYKARGWKYPLKVLMKRIKG